MLARGILRLAQQHNNVRGLCSSDFDYSDSDTDDVGGCASIQPPATLPARSDLSNHHPRRISPSRCTLISFALYSRQIAGVSSCQPARCRYPGPRGPNSQRQHGALRSNIQ
jgi:hypothetical protein